jgi:hypothetical protein
MRGQSLNVMSQPVMAVSLPSPAPPTFKSEVAGQREGLPEEEDVGEAMPGELEGTPEEQSSLRTDWAAARAAMEHAIGSVRNHVEEIARETMERRQEQRTLEEEAQLQRERKMTIYEDAETGPLDALQFPPGLEREASDSEAGSLFHSSEPTMETLVEEPDQETEASAVEHPEKVTEKLETHEFSEVDPSSRGMPVNMKELAVVPEEPVVSPKQSQVSIEESEEEGTEVDQAQASQEAAPVPQYAPVVTEEHPLDHAPLVPSGPLSTLHEESSDTHSEQLSSSLEFPRPDTPHPALDDHRVVSPVPFPLTSEHEDQGYGTQDDEDRTTQASQRTPAKRVHWGGVEAQVAYVRPQDEEDNAEEHSPPFSRLLLPAPPPLPAPVPVPVQAVSQRDVRPERAARIAALPRRAMPPALQKRMRKFEQGAYTVTDVRWGMALDLSSADNRSPIAFGSHGWENQQVSTVSLLFLFLVSLWTPESAERRADGRLVARNLISLRSGNSNLAVLVLSSRASAAARSSYSRTFKGSIKKRASRSSPGISPLAGKWKSWITVAPRTAKMKTQMFTLGTSHFVALSFLELLKEFFSMPSQHQASGLRDGLGIQGRLRRCSGTYRTFSHVLYILTSDGYYSFSLPKTQTT